VGEGEPITRAEAFHWQHGREMGFLNIGMAVTQKVRKWRGGILLHLALFTVWLNHRPWTGKAGSEGGESVARDSTSRTLA
jgi:hypothetical protein